MPVSHVTKHMPGAIRYVRTLLTGKVTSADMQHFTKLLTPGSSLHGVPLLAVVDAQSDLDAEARKVFTSLALPSVNAAPRVAMVVSSAPLRGMLSFLIRLSGANGATRFFDTEFDAQAWLLTAAQLA
jgi:hypothetical protein